MEKLTFFIGSYTEYPIPGFGGIGHGIYTVQLNTETGDLFIRHIVKSRNPSYLSINVDNNLLYAVTELDEADGPMVRSYKINNDSSLSFLNEQSITGGYPCHIVEHKKSIMVACYATGNILQYPTAVSGELKSKVNEYRHKGSSVNKERQEAPHAHQIAVHPNGKEVYACDLGIDTIKAYRFEENNLIGLPI